MAEWDILVVDDDEELLASVEDVLVGMGYRVKACSSVEQALDAALRRQFAIAMDSCNIK